MARVRIIADQARGAGRTESGTFAVAVAPVPVVDGQPQWGAPGSRVEGEVILQAADLADPTLVLDFGLEVEVEGEWRTLIAGAGWNGGNLDRGGQPITPRFGFATTRLPDATLMRGYVNASRATRFALEIETI